MALLTSAAELRPHVRGSRDHATHVVCFWRPPWLWEGASRALLHKPAYN